MLCNEAHVHLVYAHRRDHTANSPMFNRTVTLDLREALPFAERTRETV